MPSRIAPISESELDGRALWGTERFWHFAHSEHQGAFDMVSVFEIESSIAAKDLDGWARAWDQVAKLCPVLSHHVSNQQGEAKIVIHERRETSQVYLGPAIKGAQEQIDHCLQRPRFDSLALTVFQQEEGNRSVHFAISNPHALGDAKGILTIADLLICALKRQLKSVASEQVSCAPTLFTKVPAQPCSNGDDQESNLGLREMFEIAKKGSTTGFRIIPKELAEPKRDGAEWRKVHAFSKLDTEVLVRFCKARSFTVSALLQASIYHTMLQTLTEKAQATNEVQRFTVPAMPFSHPSLASSATSTVFAPVSIDIPPFASLEDTTRAVADSYALARQFSVDAQDDYVKTLLKLFNSVRPETSVPTFSSLGQLGAFDGLRSYHVASRNNLPSLGIHAYTLNGLLNLSLAWSPGRFDAKIIDIFWSKWIVALEQLSL